MSYLRKIEYRIKLDKSFRIIRNCAGCGCKMSYKNTGKFRVNANGNQVDVWLIYQCSKCRHTYNLSVYERVRPSEIPASDYRAFMENDEKLAYTTGTDKKIFIRNRAEIDAESVTYTLEGPAAPVKFTNGDIIEVVNPSGVKVRMDKLGAMILGISRSQFTTYVKQNKVLIEDNKIILEDY